MSSSVPDVIDGVNARYLLKKILDAIDQGVSTDDIRRDPMRFLTSGRTKEIIINTDQAHKGVGLLFGDQSPDGPGDRCDPSVIAIIKAGKLDVPGKEPIRLRCEGPTCADWTDGGLTVVRVPEEDTCYQVVTDHERDVEMVLGWHEFVATTHKMIY